MLSVSDAYSQKINADVREMPYRIKLAGAIELDENRVPKMSLDESVSDTSGISIGTSNSATLKFTLKDADPSVDYSGMMVEPESGLVLPDGSIEWVPLGKFWVTDISTSDDYKTLNITCADGMYHLTGDYESELTYPTHIMNVAREIAGKAGVIFKEPSPWPLVTIRKKPQGLTYREAVGYVAGCCGCNARFDRSGLLEFVWYEDNGITIERETQYMNGMTKLHNKALNVNFEVTGAKETYTVDVISDGNGGVTASPGQSVYEGDTVVLSVNPFSGYELAIIEAMTESGDKVTLYKRAEGGYTFIQPDSNVTVTASFAGGTEGPFLITVRAYDGGSIRVSRLAATEGATPTVYIKADSGYELDKFVTTPASLNLTRLGTNASGETLYEFTMPQSNVTINAYFKAQTVYYAINRTIDYGDATSAPGYLYIQDAYTKEYISSAAESTTVSVAVSPKAGYAFDRFESNVSLTQVSENVYRFVMPAEEVSITAYFKLSEDKSKDGLYSWLQTPQAPPTDKTYWAVFYKDGEDLPTCQKYYLIWFDSWSCTGSSNTYGKTEYSITFNGYYYCGSKNNGHGAHEWDTSSWSGNGASGTSLEWDACVDSMWSGGSTYGPSSQYCLLASNIHLWRGTSLIFEKCENAIKSVQTNYVQGGMDVREKGSLGYWKCPDTFSTPIPAANWMILMPDSGLYMTVEEDGTYDTPLSEFPKTMCVFFYDSISIQNLGAIFSDVLVNPSDEEVYLASFTNGHWAYVTSDSSSWGELYDIPEGAVIGFRNPLITTNSSSGSVGGSHYNFAGILATNNTLYADGSVFMYNNACRICDCETTASVSTFSLLRSVVTDGIVIDSEDITVTSRDDAIVIESDVIAVSTDGDSIVMTIGSNDVPREDITITYTNPLIYEKMVNFVSSYVKGLTYTPAKVKHRGNPAFQAGDIVTVPDKDNVYHTVLIMEQTMSFGGGMNSEISCPGKSEKAKSFSSNGPITSQIKKEVQESNALLEHRLATNNALVYAAIYKEISASEAKLVSLVEWQTEKNASIAKIEQTANDNGAKIALVVGQNGLVNEDGAVQGSIVIEAINGESTAKISADRLDIEGKELNIKVAATNITGKVTASQINAVGAVIGGWTAANGQLWAGDSTTGYTAMQAPSSSINWVFAAGGTDPNSYAKYPFRVHKDGSLYADKAFIKGDIEATSGSFKGHIEATSGSFSRDITIEGRSLKDWIDDGGYIKDIKANSGSVGGWSITGDALHGMSTYPSSIGAEMYLYANGRNFHVNAEKTAMNVFFLVVYTASGTPIGGISTSGWQTIYD